MAEFYGEVMRLLRERGIECVIYPRPNELPDATPFAEGADSALEAEATHRAIILSHVAGNVPLYIVHMSAGDALEEVELVADRAVADRMHDDVKAGRVGAAHARFHVGGLRHLQPAVAGRIGERLEHQRRVRAERAVDEALERADAEPRVAAAARGNGVAEALPRGERHGGVDARAEAARGAWDVAPRACGRG